MNDKIKELLAVLDLPEEEQWDWLYSHREEYGFELDWINRAVPSAYKQVMLATIRRSLADLAFKLRDEAVKENWGSWVYCVDTVFAYVKPKGYEGKDTNSLVWLATEGKPIHIIIAVLIAKEIANASALEEFADDYGQLKTKNDELKAVLGNIRDQLFDLYTNCCDCTPPEIYGTILGLHELADKAIKTT